MARVKWSLRRQSKDGTPVVAPVVRKQARRRLSKADPVSKQTPHCLLGAQVKPLTASSV